MPKIMLAEDDLTMVALLKTLLGLEGYQVIELGADDDVFESVYSAQPDVLLLDVHLQKVSGLDVLDQVRAHDETKGVPVVMASGLNMEDECLKRGANDFLLKPYMPDDLLKLLAKNIKDS